MRTSQALLLAKTKFRIRRVRTVAGIVASGLLFGLIVAVLSIFRNLETGIQPYLDYGVNNRFLVEARNMQFSFSANADALIKRALEIYEENRANGVYSDDELAYEYPIEKYADGTKDIKTGTQAATAAIIEIASAQNNYSIADAEALASKTSALKLNRYSATLRPVLGSTITYIDNGSENLKSLISSNYEDIIASRFSIPFYAVDDNLYSLYVDENIKTNDSEIPVLIDAALAQSINQETVEFCFRDDIATAYIIDALEGEDGTTLPQGICTQDEDVVGRTEKLKFHIVGVFPNRAFSDSANSISGLIESIASSGLPEGVVIPLAQITDKQKALIEKFYSSEKDVNSYMYNKDTFIFEFATAREAENFLDNYNCVSAICESDKPFILSESSNSAILMSDIFAKLRIMIVVAVIIVIFLAVIVLISILNRIVSDSQKENAIYIAIGYSRTQIMQIYLIYTLIYASCVALLAIIIGIFLPIIIQASANVDISMSLNTIFHTPDTYSVNIGAPTIYVFFVITGIYVVSILCVVFTIFARINQNIIRQLRK